MLILRGVKDLRFKPSDFLLQWKLEDDPAPVKPVEDGGRKEGKPAEAAWQRMKFIAQQQVALANAEQKRLARRKR